MRDENRQALLGSTSVRVEEFQPDRMTIKAELSTPPAAGWISPDALSATVKLAHVVRHRRGGTQREGVVQADAVGGRVREIPRLPVRRSLRHVEKLRRRPRRGCDRRADGTAKFDFKLERFDKGLYSLRFIAEGFEPEGGRSVVTDAAAIVSPAPYLVAYKADGDLGYIDKDSVRSVHLIAVGPKLDKVAVSGLTTELIEFRYVSVLTQAGKRHARVSIGAQGNLEGEKSARDSGRRPHD